SVRPSGQEKWRSSTTMANDMRVPQGCGGYRATSAAQCSLPSTTLVRHRSTSLPAGGAALPGEGVVGQPLGEQVDVERAAGDAAGAAGQAGLGMDGGGAAQLADVAVCRG